MWQYQKKLQYPINIKNPDPRAAQIIIDQYGGPDGELGASMRYLTQRYSMPYDDVKGILTDIGVEDGSCAFKNRRISFAGLKSLLLLIMLRYFTTG